MKPIAKNEQMKINGGVHYHWKCTFGDHDYKSVARTKFSAIRWRDYHNNKYHSGERRAKLIRGCRKKHDKIYENIR